MRIILLFIFLLFGRVVQAQLQCSAGQPGALALSGDKGIPANGLYNITSRFVGDGKGVITIPVVFHILYNNAAQNIDQSVIAQQLAVLNTAFRKKNADTVNIPAAFKSLAADCEIEFKLATSDPFMRPTNGIVRKYTAIKNWMDDDKMKSSATNGTDGWDPRQYLNIWVCNLALSSGYSTFPGDAAAKDGIVIKTALIGKSKVLIHEAGHWLGLKHLWGDTVCGDDLVDDTPKQSTYTPGCPTGIRSSCGGTTPGDMYMNYMDFTADACILMFTQGQKERMWSFFYPGGARASVLNSLGLNPPTKEEIPLPGDGETPAVKPVEPALKVYPNPAVNKIIIDAGTDNKWLGKTVNIYDTKGEIVLRTVMTSQQHAIDISRLITGMYFIAGKNEEGNIIRVKFVKN